jgi:hypothetical protein
VVTTLHQTSNCTPAQSLHVTPAVGSSTAEFTCTPVVSMLPAPRLSTSVARPCVQVVTHLCYFDFQDIMKAVDDMDGETENSARGARV